MWLFFYLCEIPNYLLRSAFYLSIPHPCFLSNSKNSLSITNTVRHCSLLCEHSSRPIVYLELGRMGVVHVQKCAGVHTLAEHLEGQRRHLCCCPLTYSLKNRLSLIEPKA